MKRRPLVFISYSSDDNEIAQQVAIICSLEGAKVWFDEYEVAPGESISSKVSSGIANCTHCVLIWSKHSAKSKWVSRELYSAISGLIKRKIKIIPVKTDATKLPAILADLKFVDYRNREASRLWTGIGQALGNAPSARAFVFALIKAHSDIYEDYQKAISWVFDPNTKKVKKTRVKRLRFDLKEEIKFNWDELLFYTFKECGSSHPHPTNNIEQIPWSEDLLSGPEVIITKYWIIKWSHTRLDCGQELVSRTIRFKGE